MNENLPKLKSVKDSGKERHPEEAEIFENMLKDIIKREEGLTPRTEDDYI